MSNLNVKYTLQKLTQLTEDIFFGMQPSRTHHSL